MIFLVTRLDGLTLRNGILGPDDATLPLIDGSFEDANRIAVLTSDLVTNGDGSLSALLDGEEIALGPVIVPVTQGTLLIALASGEVNSMIFDSDFSIERVEAIYSEGFTAAGLRAWRIEPGSQDLVPHFADFEQLRLGTSGADRLVGTGADEELRGLGGSDTLIGKGGVDQLLGGNGNDSLQGGGGADTLEGGGGKDSLIGGGGGDVLNGGGGRNRLNGGTGEDDLFGGGGRDVLVGGGAADFLDGGAGRDVLTGGAGNDQFNFAGGPRDRVTDFEPDVDQLSFVGATPDDLRIVQKSAGTLVRLGGIQVFLEDVREEDLFGGEEFLYL